MEGSSSPSHEEERRATFYAYHPCYFLQEALRALLRCLGIESGSSMCSQAKQERSSLPQTHAAADPPSTTEQTIQSVVVVEGLQLATDQALSIINICHGSALGCFVPVQLLSCQNFEDVVFEGQDLL
ncbi:unnamed protein product [Sphenostylis stenocarpa]|uniref:Uncharacterized protein n=1 Tax=Sphenostylis stenocarpa TaxID=92480 RepID=A0AA86W210_9FABA|nr:unnamed protein product [Sphenostylis stenocarpa]